MLWPDSKRRSTGLMVMKPVRRVTGASIAANAWQHCVSVGSQLGLFPPELCTRVSQTRWKPATTGRANAVIRLALTFRWGLSVEGYFVANMIVISSRYQATTLPGSYRPLTFLRHVSESNEAEAETSTSVAAVVDTVELGVAVVPAVVLGFSSQCRQVDEDP